jgi:ProP effector
MKSMNTSSLKSELVPELNTELNPELSTEINAEPSVSPAAPAATAPVQDNAAASPAPAAPAETAPASAPGSARALLKQFQEQFPPFRNCLPLSIGIDKQLLARLPDLDRKLMRTALGIHTGSLRYLRAMEKAKVRYDLDGKPGAEVTQTHRDHAGQVLQQRFKKEAERKKAERDAAAVAREAAAAEEANRLRLEKLNQLTAKFSRKN